MAKKNELQEQLGVIIDQRIQKLVPDMVEEAVERALAKVLGAGMPTATPEQPRVVRRRRKANGETVEGGSKPRNGLFSDE